MKNEYARESLGLEIAWVDDEPDTIIKATSYLVGHNFLVDICKARQETAGLVINNGYDALLVDLHLGGEERGTHLVHEVRGAKKELTIIPVSAYLRDYEDDLPADCKRTAFDKSKLGTQRGYEALRRHILHWTRGGRIRVLERLVGYVEEETEQAVVACLKLPDGSKEHRVFNRKHLETCSTGTFSQFFELVTIERRRDKKFRPEIVFHWLPEMLVPRPSYVQKSPKTR